MKVVELSSQHVHLVISEDNLASLVEGLKLGDPHPKLFRKADGVAMILSVESNEEHYATRPEHHQTNRQAIPR